MKTLLTDTSSNTGQPLPRNNNDDWDSFVASQNNGWLTMTSEWGKVLKLSFPNITEKTVVVSENGQIAGGLPLYECRSLLQQKKLISTPFATISDPLVSTEALAMECIEKIRHDYVNRKLPKIEITVSTLEHPEWLKDFSLENDFVIHEINLQKPLETIFKAFHRTCIQQHIRKTQQAEIKFEELSAPEDINVFYKLYFETRKRLGLPAMSLKFFHNCAKHLIPKGYAHFFVALHNGTPVAALMALTYNNRFSAETLGWDHEQQKLEPVIALFWHTIQWAHEHGLKVFDFGRTATDNESLLRFKDHWGTGRRTLKCYSNSRSNDKRFNADARSKVQGILKKLPAPLFGLISLLFYI